MKCPDCKIDMVIIREGVFSVYAKDLYKCPKCGIEIEEDDEVND